MKRSYFEFSLFITFFTLIVLGAICLELPFVKNSGGLPWLDALFMATSAVCVTGLATVPVSGFNHAGQIILLALMQLGAIGIMTLSSGLVLFFIGGLDLRRRMLASRITETYTLKEVEGVIGTILKFTFITELIGFVFLSLGFFLDGFSFDASLYQGMFHAISAFCNAGFSTFDNSLVGVNSLIKITVILLIIMGGIGYYVVFDLCEFCRKRDRITIHTKIVVLGTGGLIVFGALAFYGLEGGAVSLLDAVFQSVTARTAGFNTVDITNLHTINLFVLIILMIIGAAPGSTGGGVKITTFIVSVLAVYNVILGRDRVVVFGRKLPLENVLRAYALIVLYVLFFMVGSAFLLYFEEKHFINTVFEMASAFGTVGLSLGLTTQVGPIGKIILIIGMFVGRVGPAAMVLMLLRHKKTSHIDFPEEKIILG